MKEKQEEMKANVYGYFNTFKNDSGFSYDIIYLYLNLQINLEKKYINSRTMCVKATHLYIIMRS